MKKFDRRFGKKKHLELPNDPGVYRFFDASGALIYVGKAKNLKRRLSQYRNARRCKAHAKMRKIVSEAVHFEYEICPSELAALSLENRLIQEHRPKWNIAGAFFFLYPLIGVKMEQDDIFFCCTTRPELYPEFRFHGAFRSRFRTREGFFSLIELLRLIGHPIPKNHLLKRGVLPVAQKHEYSYGFRQIPEAWRIKLNSFLSGESFEAIEELSLLLLDHAAAVRKAKQTQDLLRAIRRFWFHEIITLKNARARAGHPHYPVSQKERDWVFIQAARCREKTSSDTGIDSRYPHSP